MLDYKSLLEGEWADQNDPTHDIAHIERVVKNAMKIQKKEDGDLSVILPAAWFHDLINLPKDHPERSRASEFAADRAVDLLKQYDGFEQDHLNRIHHAIMAHSFSSGHIPETLEAKIVQDADRLDSLGAIGIMRTFAVSGQLKRPLFDSSDPFAKDRELDDAVYGLDHFEVKLFTISKLLHTETAKQIAADRVCFMKAFLKQLNEELT